MVSSKVAFGALGVGLLMACAAGETLDTSGAYEEGGAGEGDAGAGDDGGDAGTTGPTGPTGGGPGTFDSGPPATIGGGSDSGASGADAGEGGGPPANGSCSTLAECPYASATQVAGVACVDGGCVITCAGENYDVNGLLADGCEVPATAPKSQGTVAGPIDDHTQALAANAGSYPCADGSSMQNMQGTVPSDARAHQPPVDGFDAVTGAAPDYFSINATGGLTCQDDANLDLVMNAPTAQLPCYTLHLLTDKNGGQTCQTDATGHCSIPNGSGSYSDNSTIFVWISKTETCTAQGFPDDGTFQITGHL